MCVQWRKVKQRRGLGNRWEGYSLYRGVTEDLAERTLEERSEKGPEEEGRAEEQPAAKPRQTHACELTDKQEASLLD